MMKTLLKNHSIPRALGKHYAAITDMTDKFCNAYLTKEYLQLARTLTAALARKRPSPLVTGSIDSWAAGILYALGSNNFLSDRSQQPTMPLFKLCRRLGVSSSTGAAKAKQIRQLAKISHWDHRWMLPSRIKDSPIAWMISVNGIMMDARSCPRDVQEIAFQKGLIPYIPS